jgi:hypothetical protein
MQVRVVSESTVGEQLAVINTKLDVLIEQRTDHEVRLRSLEKFRWVLAGAALAGGGLSTAVAQALFQ